MTATAARVQGSLWGARARDYADLAEGLFRPLYEAVLTETGVRPGTRLLDVGCGPGLAAQLAAQRGARVAGLDAATASLAIARERTPDGDFREGDLEQLPWPDAYFDIVTGFNSFQFATNRPAALAEAKRVSRPGGRVAIAVWGDAADCETMVTVSAVVGLLPPPSTPPQPPLSEPAVIDALLRDAGLTPMTAGEVDCPFEFPNLELALRGLMSAGVMVAATNAVGFAAVRDVVADSLRHFRTPDGRYRQHNRFRYVIASA